MDPTLAAALAVIHIFGFLTIIAGIIYGATH